MFARNASDALQLIADLRTTARHVRALSVAGVIPSDDPGSMASDADWADWLSFERRLEPYVWSAETAAIVSAAAKSYPLELEAAISLSDRERIASRRPPGYLPRVTSALCVFSAPCVWIEMPQGPVPLSALGWDVGVSVKRGELWLVLRGIVWLSGGRAAVVFFADGGPVGPVHYGGVCPSSVAGERIELTKWACSAGMFIDQEIVRVDGVVGARAFRRRLCATGIDEAPLVNVVTLRREVESSEAAARGDVGAIEWARRWVVRGHWRRQYFPRRQCHAPVWIDPYVKGPEGKPFIAPAPTVFRVAR